LYDYFDFLKGGQRKSKGVKGKESKEVNGLNDLYDYFDFLKESQRESKNLFDLHDYFEILKEVKR
jgi:hypothetical protein